jgi:hypothetical protein
MKVKNNVKIMRILPGFSKTTWFPFFTPPVFGLDISILGQPYPSSGV